MLGLGPVKSTAKGPEAGTTGRMCIRAPTWLTLGGYDQEDDVAPSGFQDIDMRNRATKMGTCHHMRWGATSIKTEGRSLIGTALRNSYTSKHVVLRFLNPRP